MICPIELKFSEFVVLSKFCGISIDIFHPLHFVEVMHRNVYCIFFIRSNWSPFNVSLTLYAYPKNYSLGSVLVGVIFSQASSGIPQQVADVFSRCQVTIQF